MVVRDELSLNVTFEVVKRVDTSLTEAEDVWLLLGNQFLKHSFIDDCPDTVNVPSSNFK